MIILEYTLIFLLWTALIYWMHRIVHMIYIPYLYEWHMDHHKQVSQNKILGLHWSNLFLYNDTWKSTLDLWAIEVIPTIIFCWIFNCWWIFFVYWFWAAFIQEAIEHNKNFDWYPWLTSGKWHILHHNQSKFNFGVYFPIWDILLKTHKRH